MGESSWLSTTLSPKGEWDTGGDASAVRELPALMIAWCAAEPARVGEVALLPDEEGRILGRGPGQGDAPRVTFVRQGPGLELSTTPLAGRGLSRDQLRVSARGQRITLERIGLCPLVFDGREVDRAEIAPGATVLLRGQLLLFHTRRPERLPGGRDLPLHAIRGFGEPDGFDMVGESPAAWRVRDQIGFAAKTDNHVLLVGESGSGKELAAQAIHRLSRRSRGPFVARNAATLPPGLIDAELFGNVKNYPNPGNADRPGLIGQADGGTLFLDEVGELPAELQAHLLRVLDGDGEYQRLGEATPRRSRFRLIGATNRPPQSLKHDFLARFTLQVRLPGFDARRDDIPLLVRHLLRRAAAANPEIGARFLDGKEGRGEPRVSPSLIDVLLRHRYRAHARELESLLWQAVAGSSESLVTLTEEVRARCAASASHAPLEPGAPMAPLVREQLTADSIRGAIADAGGNLSRAATALGLSSRFALYRLLKRRGIDVGALRAEPNDAG